MAGLSDIEWTDATWNPVAGCTIISPGCTNCYAMRMAARLEAMDHPSYRGTTRKSGKRYVWTGKANLIEAMLDQPLAWRKPRRIFVNSMSDLFQDAVPDAHIERIWSVMEQASWHQFQILTKRPDRMASFLDNRPGKPAGHIWVGTSVESAKFRQRIAMLRTAKAAVRFVSFEPLIGPLGRINLHKIDWAIVGGESGPRSRPMEAAWVEQIRTACEHHGTAFFFKQWGGVNKKKTGRIYRGRTWDAYPVELSVA